MNIITYPCDTGKKNPNLSKHWLITEAYQNIFLYQVHYTNIIFENIVYVISASVILGISNVLNLYFCWFSLEPHRIQFNHRVLQIYHVHIILLFLCWHQINEKSTLAREYELGNFYNKDPGVTLKYFTMEKGKIFTKS